MKLISASIIILAGAVLIAGGGHIRHGDTQLFVMAVGTGVGLVGFWGWFGGLKEK